jgi:hypothetical protein
MMPMLKSRNYSAVAVSLAIHVVVLGTMWMIRYSDLLDDPAMVLETIFSEERDPQEVTQELQLDTEVAETPNIVAGGAVSTAVGGSAAPAVNQVRIEESQTLQDPQIEVNVADVSLPGEATLTEELGESEVTGQVGEIVEGYGAALGIITRELVRMMREQRVHVVWMFDESESMKDDQDHIREQFHKVYEELGIVQQQDRNLRRNARGDDILLTSIHSFGEKMHVHTPQPTADINKIREAIGKIGVDDSGIENTCEHTIAVLEQYGSMSQRNKRKLVVIIVSDESGEMEDGNRYLEQVITRAKRIKSPLYILGREAIFGYPYARFTWQDPIYGLTHWIRIDRGPETARAECLQWDGLHHRWDSFSSGFGPYVQVRMARETGGIFFVLPSTEPNLAGAGSRANRKFDFLDMKEYQPDLNSRREYEVERNASKFRKSIWDIIVTLNPYLDDQLNIRSQHYPIAPAEFQVEGVKNFQKAVRAMELLNRSMGILEDIKPLRAQEKSMRWRANFDLLYAQCLSYRVRLFQYMLAFDEHSRDMPKPEDKKSNEWNARRVPKTRVPDEEQFSRIKQMFKISMSREEYLAELQNHQDEATRMYQSVMSEHPRTPWAQRAEHELKQGFGMEFREGFRDPRYAEVGKKIKVPKF